jgi:hydrogenase maturation protein HypF
MNRPPPSAVRSLRRLAITVRGVVQGVGFRPFVYNAARARGLAGWVRNEAGMVRIEVEGERVAVDAFLSDLRARHPPQARIDSIDVQDIQDLSPKTKDLASFQILTSEGQSAPCPTIPADLTTCRECLAEIRDPSERRYNYPFTNCTNCGPRWSIIEQLPYDRPRTSMAAFAMCPDCRAEYENPADRRFHAQPIACRRCGPSLRLLECGDSSPLFVRRFELLQEAATQEKSGDESPHSKDALNAAAALLLAGRIVALKGLGGFQLLADATNAEAVVLLRRRKRRPDRPFAIMVATLDEARRYCDISEAETGILTSHQSPIVLLRRLSSPLSPLPSPLSPVPGVAPGNPYLGVMLPYTPLHHLLLAAVGRPLVCTSGNLSEEPMAITIEDAQERLGPIADAILTHNRPIVRPVDDSIVRLGPTGPQVLRRARGFAPLAIELRVGTAETPTVLAVGGHLKNTVALALGRVHETHQTGKRGQSPTNLRSVPAGTARRVLRTNGDCPLFPVDVVLSAHVGDLDSVPSVEVFRRAIDDLVSFFQVTPEIVACDLHPDYASTRHAEQLAARWGVPLVRVQHHHAHVAACMAEHGLNGPVLGFSWDGTGYGPDGTVWGGEVLLCDGAEYRRVAQLRTFALPGGEAAVRQPRRSALGLLFEMFGSRAADYAAQWFSPSELRPLLSMLTQQVNSPRTSSMGRLFDAVAALCGLPPVISFEGQAAMSLEYAADEKEQESYAFTVGQVANLSYDTMLLDWEPLVRAVLADRAAGLPVSRISARFHNALADLTVSVAERLAPTKALPIILTGGCFQNALLAARAHARLSAAGYSVYTHNKVPPGDGGIALGQVFVALMQA